jgi:CHAT domain-containing protein
MQPVRARLGTAKQLLIAPDGALNLIPFEALVDERGRFQVERYAMSYLGSGRDVLRMQVTRAAASPPVVIADPAFGEPPVTKSGPVYFAPLEGTRQEGEDIGRLLPGAVVLTGSRATKAALEQIGAPSILHIASHAFFLPENGAPAAAAVPDTRSMTTAVQSSNPLLRSGIALAGANLSRPGDPGILTALEASTLNLWGTRLVTLSACDTGVGDVKTGEGVYGLRRAFFVAGTESLVMSLWPISDNVTRSVMTRYYAGLARGEGRSAALRRVQLAMLADKNRHHPFYWAGFIEAGDWTPIR